MEAFKTFLGNGKERTDEQLIEMIENPPQKLSIQGKIEAALFYCAVSSISSHSKKKNRNKNKMKSIQDRVNRKEAAAGEALFQRGMTWIDDNNVQCKIVWSAKLKFQ